MHTVDLLQDALRAAREAGFEIRCEWLNGTSGGVCHLGKKKFLFVDLSLTAVEQLDQVVKALRDEPTVYEMKLTAPLMKLVSGRSQ